MTLFNSKKAGMLFGSVVAASLAFATVAAEARDLRGWNIHVEDYPVSHGMEAFLKEVDEKTGGEISGKVFHAGVLGSQPDAIEQTRLGVIDFGVFSLGPMGQVVPEANVVSLPFIFKSVSQMYEVMDGEPGKALSKGLEAKGLVALGYYDAGARSFYTSAKAITEPADLTGMKIRVMNNDLFVGMVDSMGGNATPMAFAEVYQAIKTGVVDGAENNPPSYESTNHFEVAQFYSLTQHLIIPECLCMSKRTFDSLTPEQQAIVIEAGRNSTELQRKLWQEREAASMAKVAEGGVAVNEIADKAAFQAAMEPVYAQFLEQSPDLAGLVEMFKNAE
ncbi:TRAP transporter substrate-binding protein [Roseibium porphyridii]|uniref:TRAP transporter substrate-binding protein n=1 Tax=Roseibium porphyridii TaxID=2866279 RepID=A0ABY8F5W6_9HYPH|nr:MULTISPECIES: TRAP transporter substrate-binding protein [Stappiaceae]QFT34489.1 2,3-diketo-L-gulonate-binding periplasmic protein YiaO precursor [Labrenzia sp. THAF82]WFE89462.1 TRAP transporter substrate-binding protein [Roseibium sp. KMA01]